MKNLVLIMLVTMMALNTEANSIENRSDSNDHRWIDLGLPSGTLWATMNVGASSPEDYGDYFAWGETSPKEVYSLSTYKWCKGAENTQTKYCSDSELGIVDNKKTLDPDDDAATINWGPSWRMPTEAQMQELITRCNWKASTMKGVKGYSVTGPNGATMFLPAALCRGDGPIDDIDWGGFYWSSESPGFIDASGGLTFGEGGASWAFLYRFGGCSVRPVRVLDK